jgi:protein-tyrosine-phosphatase
MKTILFVCVHNSGRSHLTAAYLNRLAGNKARAISAGTRPSKRVNPTVIEAMLEEGIDISKNKPTLLTQEMIQESSRVISMGCIDADSCPVRLVQMEDWRLPDPEGKNMEEVKQIRDEIKQRVIKLIDSL